MSEPRDDMACHVDGSCPTVLNGCPVSDCYNEAIHGHPVRLILAFDVSRTEAFCNADSVFIGLSIEAVGTANLVPSPFLQDLSAPSERVW